MSERKIVYYEVEFFSYWHCSSGQAAGADVDELVVKDSDGLPYIPGRTLKGLLRDAANEIGVEQTIVYAIFGKEPSKDEFEDELVKGKCFFSNAELPIEEHRYLANHKILSRHLFQKIAATAIDENGTTKDHSLRKSEVVVPCKLLAEVHGVTDNQAHVIEQTMRYIKRLGKGRSRGLGRCAFKVVKCI